MSRQELDLESQQEHPEPQTYTTREFLKLLGAGVLAPAVAAEFLAACRPRTDAPTQAAAAVPDIPISDRALMPQELITATQEAARAPTPEAVQPKKLWEIRITKNPLGGPAFASDGNRLFTNNQQGLPAEIDLGGNEIWRWANKGTVLGAQNNTLYLLHAEVPRIYAIDIQSKDTKWRFDMQAPLSAPQKGKLIFDSPEHFGLQTAGLFTVINKRSGRSVFSSKGILNYLTDKLAIAQAGDSKGTGFISTNLERQGLNSWEMSDAFLGIADDETITATIAIGSVPGVRTPEHYELFAFEASTREELWSQSFNFPIQPLFINKDVVIIKNSPTFSSLGRQPNYYYVLDRDTGDIITNDQSPAGVDVKVFGNEIWWCGSHPQQGTSGANSKDINKAWLNDEILNADNLVTEVGDVLILSRRGTGQSIGGMIWAVNKNTGKFVWQPQLFEPITAGPIMVGNQLVVADRTSTRINLHVIDITSGKRETINAASNTINRLHAAGNLVFGEVSGDKLFAAKV